MSDTKKFAVILSGNGVYDGSEIHEATMTLYAIVKNGGEYEIFAPDIEQHHVINHITGKEMDETRNVLIESARIARGNIKPLSEFSKEDFDAIVFPGGFGVAKNLCSFAFDNIDCTVNPEVEKVIKEMDETRNVLIESARIARGNIKPLNEFNKGDFDAIVFPGGFGVAKNLCSFAFDNVDCTVNPEVEKIIKEMAAARKPIGALCISPVLIARVLGNITVTIGQDTGTAESIEKLGAMHKNTDHGEVIIDEENKIITTPCYMLDANITQIAEGADAVVKAIYKLFEV